MTTIDTQSQKLNNGDQIKLHSDLIVTVINDRGYCISVKSHHPAWNGRAFFITRAEIKSIEHAND